MIRSAAEILGEYGPFLRQLPDDEQAKIAGGNTARMYNFDVARLTVPD
jgi:hypothetical protein